MEHYAYVFLECAFFQAFWEEEAETGTEDYDVVLHRIANGEFQSLQEKVEKLEKEIQFMEFLQILKDMMNETYQDFKELHHCTLLLKLTI